MILYPSWSYWGQHNPYPNLIFLSIWAFFQFAPSAVLFVWSVLQFIFLHIDHASSQLDPWASLIFLPTWYLSQQDFPQNLIILLAWSCSPFGLFLHLILSPHFDPSFTLIPPPFSHLGPSPNLTLPCTWYFSQLDPCPTMIFHPIDGSCSPFGHFLHSILSPYWSFFYLGLLPTWQVYVLDNYFAQLDHISQHHFSCLHHSGSFEPPTPRSVQLDLSSSWCFFHLDASSDISVPNFVVKALVIAFKQPSCSALSHAAAALAVHCYCTHHNSSIMLILLLQCP